MARFTRTHAGPSEEIWTYKQLQIRVWPSAGGWRCQDGLLHTWTLSDAEHTTALTEGLDVTTMDDVAPEHA